MADIRSFFKKGSISSPSNNNNNKRVREHVDIEDEEEDAFVPKAGQKPTKTKTKQVDENIPLIECDDTTPKKKLKTKDVDPLEKKRRVENFKTFMNRGGADAPGSKTIPDGAPNCLKNLTFVISGVLESLERDDCKDLIEKYGGRVTGSISSKTGYLLVGRDGGESKITKARDLKVKIISEDDLLQMIATRPGDDVTPKKLPIPSAHPQPPPSPVKSKPTPNVTVVNVEKPKITLSTPPMTTTQTNNSQTTPKLSIDESTLMWADKYKPQTIKNLIGQQGEKSCVQKLTVWLRDWYKHHGRSDEKIKAKPSNGFNRNEDPALFKAALLSGPPGIGKTTAAQLVCEHLNMEYIEKNASDQRSKKLVATFSSDSHSVASFTNKSTMSNCVLIMDEVDGVAGNEDRGGIQELILLIKRTRIPIICICNDRQHKKIRSLANYCYDLRFYRPTVQQIRGAMMTVLHRENIHQIKQETLDEIIKSCNQDVRQTLHSLNLWAIEGETNPNAAKMINKAVNNNPFELCRVSFSDDLRQKSLSDKLDIFFYDYQLMPLLIQENYLQCAPTLSNSDNHKQKVTDIEQLSLLAKAAESMCIGDVCSQMIYSRNDSWSLLPYQGIFSTVAPCSYVRGHLRGMVNFSSFFGQRSRTNKNERLLNEIEKHICLKIASANKQQFNLDYLSYIAKIFIQPLQKLQQQGVEQCIALLDEYYLNRDDFQTIMELNTWGKTGKNPYDQLDTQTKSSLTRIYNKTTHRTPYAVIDMKKLKKSKGNLDEDDGEESDGDEEDKANEEEGDLEQDAMIKMAKKRAAKPAAKKPKGK
ncbi:unnamed protein product [Adineta steineri]|uniref:Replication factor C subunit 1 n=2 Tax=Adineta steineri TaxID=433720 RepID=A0A818VW76_9BILA|nr:unnamed protein product [Adineta steineri]CAF3716800.1 unnamed protein product [Adineta steineri]